MNYPDMNNKLGQARAQQQKEYNEALQRHQEAMARWMLDNQDKINKYLQEMQAEALRNMFTSANMGNQSFKQGQSTFNYAPQKPAISYNHWSIVLGVSPSATVAEIKSAYRQKAKAAHADAGGSDEAMSRLNVARDQAIKERQQR